MRVRPLRDEADVRELLVAHARSWRAAYEGLLPPSVIDRVADEAPDDERVNEAVDRLTGYGDGRVFVVEGDGGTVRGYVVFRWGDNETKDSVGPDEAELKELYVDPDYWGQGYGTALFETGLERLPDDIDAVVLETLEGNRVAIDFYEGRGFEPVGEASFAVDGEAFPTLVYRRSVS